MTVFLIVIVIAALLAERWSMAHALEGVEYETEPDHVLVEIDQTFHVVSVLTNRSKRFVPFLRMVEQLPREMKTGLHTWDSGMGNSDHINLSSTVFLMPKQKLTRSFEASLPARGRYFLNGATLYGGDFLGLKEVPMSVLALKEIIVLPAACDVPELEDTLGGFLGDISVNRFILEDPILTAGFRDYTGREPQKMIAWAQTLRSGKMMVKNYDHTMELSVSVILNVYDPEGRFKHHERMEKAFSMARTVAETLEEKAVPYAFYTNAVAAGTSQPFNYIPGGLGMSHLNAVLEGLGRATYDSRESLSQLLEHPVRRAEQSQAYIVISSSCEDDDAHPIELFRERTGSEVLRLDAVINETEES